MPARSWKQMTKNTVHELTKYVYVPEGIEDLFTSYPRSVQIHALDIVSKIAAKPEGLRCNVHGDQGTKNGFQGVLRFYGRTGTRGAQQWVWYVVIDRLVSKGVIFVSEGHMIGVRAKRYALTPEWAERPLVRLPDDGKHNPTPLRTPAAPVPPWARYCLQKVVFDLPGAVRLRLVNAGVAVELADQLAESLDFNAIGAAVKAVVGEDKIQISDDLVIDQNTGEEFHKDLADPATWTRVYDLAELGKAKAHAITSELKPLFRWVVDGASEDDDVEEEGPSEATWKVGRDAFGLRLHSPVTNLASDLRRFLSFGALAPAGTKIMKIDATNAQVVFLAKLVRAQLDTADALAFEDTAANGGFYEATFRTLYGCDPSRTTMIEYSEKVEFIDRDTLEPRVKFRKVMMTERDAWKKRVMGGWLFSEAKVQRRSDEAKAISALWPAVDTLVRGEKLKWSYDEAGVLTPGGTRSLPRQLQRAESALWIDALVPALEAEKIPVLNIHDAVLVPDVHAARTLEIIESLYLARGMRAKFDRELIAA